MLTAKEVRDYIKDFPDSNPKWDDELFSDEEINLAIKYAKELAEEVPPVKDGLGFDSYPKTIQMLAVLSELYRQKALNLQNNFLPGVVENGLNLSNGEEMQIFENIAEKYYQMFIARAKLFKKSYHVRRTFSTLTSPYRGRRR